MLTRHRLLRGASIATLLGTIQACSSGQSQVSPEPEPTTAPTVALPDAGPNESNRILKLAELNTEQIRRLDRDKTVVIIPGGILEQHGPYLPSFTDGYRNEYARDKLARAVVGREGWTALLFPTIPLGAGGAHQIGGHEVFPGSYDVESSTLRSIFVDLGSDLAKQGFKWIFVVHIHGAPSHNLALDQAGDYFRDTFGGRMVHLYGLMPIMFEGGPKPTEAEKAQNGHDIHAGRIETSAILHMQPHLVAPGYHTAPSLPGHTWDELFRIAESNGWPGYFGAPKQATAAEGKMRADERASLAARTMWEIVDGKADERKMARWSDVYAKFKALRDVVAAETAARRAHEKKFQAWLDERRRRQSPTTVEPEEK